MSPPWDSSPLCLLSKGPRPLPFHHAISPAVLLKFRHHVPPRHAQLLPGRGLAAPAPVGKEPSCSLRPRGPRRGWGLGLGGGRGPEWSTQGHHSEPGPCPHCCRSSPEPALVVLRLTLTPTPTCTAAQAHVSSSPLLGPVLSRGRDSGMTETQALPTHGSRSHWGHEGGRRRRPDTSNDARGGGRGSFGPSREAPWRRAR